MLQRPQNFFKKHDQQAPAPAPLSAPSSSSSSLSSETKISKAEQPTQQNQMARIPEDVFKGILAPMIELKEVKNIVPASKAQALLFSNDQLRSRMKENDKIHRLFQQVTRGEQAEVKAMLDAAKNRSPEELIKLLTTKHTISDHAKRQFDNITLFQLALWYLDSHMWRMLLTYFKDQGVREALRGEAYRQYQEHRSGQTQYAKEHGEYYQFEGKEPGREGLVTELQAFSEFSWLDGTQAGRAGEKWQSGVGRAQARSPLHVIQEYCRVDGPNFADPLPETRFKEEHLPRTVYFYGVASAGRTFWEGLASGLGSAFGIYRGQRRSAYIAIGRCAIQAGPSADSDLVACRRLGQVRLEEYQALEPKLKKDLESVVDPSTEAAAAVESSPSLSL